MLHWYLEFITGSFFGSIHSCGRRNTSTLSCIAVIITIAVRKQLLQHDEVVDATFMKQFNSPFTSAALAAGEPTSAGRSGCQTAQIFQRVSPSLTITCCSGDILPSRFLFCSLEIHYVPGCTKVIWSVPLKAPCSVPNPTLDTLTQIGTWKLTHTAESSESTVKLLFTAACQNI